MHDIDWCKRRDVDNSLIDTDWRQQINKFHKLHFSDSGRTSSSTYAGTCVMSPVID